MKSLAHICLEAEKTLLPKLSSIHFGALETVAEDWIDNMDIIGHTIIPDSSLIITAMTQTKDGLTPKYFLFRFFICGVKWEVSADLNGVTHEKFMERLMARYAN